MDTSAAHIKHHGLINHGATCYLNSVLQVLFMTKDFREAVQRLTNDNPEFIDRHLKDLFDDLLQRTAYTFKILNSLHIDRVYEQQDAAEYLEKILRLCSPDAAKIFHGELTSITSCSKCGAETNRDGSFWHLPLPLVDSSNGCYSVVNGLTEFFKTSYLIGENQMYCEQCDTKVNGERKHAVKHHPDVLILLLKRFDFSYRYMSFVKINCDVDVPYTLNIPENQEYELYAVVNHFGDLRSGHYAATIKDQDEDKWYDFDDTTVRKLFHEPFLDNEKSVNSRSWSAYLLFYRKKDTAAQEGMVLTCENCNQSHVAETDRRTNKHEHSEEVSVDPVEVAPNRTSTDHNFKVHHLEVNAEPAEPELSDCSPQDHVREQKSNEENILRDDQTRFDRVQTENRSSLHNDAQLEVKDSENPEPVEFNQMKPDFNPDFTLINEKAAQETAPYRPQEISNAQRKELGDETYENQKMEKLVNRPADSHHDTESSSVGQNSEYHCGNQIDFNVMKPDFNPNFTLINERAAVEAASYRPQQISNAQRKELGEETGEGEKTENIEELVTWPADNQHDTESSNVGENPEYHCGNQIDGRDDGPKPIDAAKVGDEVRMKWDINKDETGGRIQSDKVKSHKELLTKYDLCRYGYKNDHGQQNIPKDYQKHVQGKQEKEDGERADMRGNDHDAGQNKSGQRTGVTHEMQSTTGSKPTAISEMQGVSERCQSLKQPGDKGTKADWYSEAPSGDQRSKITQNTKTAEETSHATSEKHESHNEANANMNFNIDKVKPSLSTSISSRKPNESFLHNCRTKVTDEQMVAAGIKHTLKKRGLKQSKRRGYAGQTGPAACRKRKRLNMKKYLGVFPSHKGRRTRIRIQRRIKKKSAPV